MVNVAYLVHFVLFICFRSEKIQNLMREGGEKNIGEKKNIEPFFGKVNEGDETKKNISQISRRKNKQIKSIAGKMFFYLLFVSRWVFSSPEVSCFFRKSATI